MDTPADVTELMPIGRFARACRLTPKALRLYAELGLLPPRFIDPDSGYRYYDAVQLPQANLIALLRQLDMPLDRIARVLTFPSNHAALEVEAYQRGVEHDSAAKAALALHVRRLLENTPGVGVEVNSRWVPEQQVMSLQRNVFMDELGTFIDAALASIRAYLGRHRLEASGDAFVLYHREVNEDSDGPAEVCVPFSGIATPSGRLRLRLEPAHHEAYVRLNCKQMKLPGRLEVYGALHAWLLSERKEAADVPREIYLPGWQEAKEDEPACDVAWPCR